MYLFDFQLSMKYNNIAKIRVTCNTRVCDHDVKKKTFPKTKEKWKYHVWDSKCSGDDDVSI